MTLLKLKAFLFEGSYDRLSVIQFNEADVLGIHIIDSSRRLEEIVDLCSKEKILR